MPSLFLAWNYCYSWGDVAGYRRSLCHKTSICFVLLLRSLVLLQPQLVMTLAAPKFTMHNVFFFFYQIRLVDYLSLAVLAIASRASEIMSVLLYIVKL